MVVRILGRSLVRGACKALGLDSPYTAKSYGVNWSKQRRRCLERDEWQCRVCAVGRDELDRELSVHHITPRRQYDGNWEQNELSNLVTVCNVCHGRFEGRFTGASPEEFAAKAKQEL